MVTTIMHTNINKRRMLTLMVVEIKTELNHQRERFDFFTGRRQISLSKSSVAIFNPLCNIYFVVPVWMACSFITTLYLAFTTAAVTIVIYLASSTKTLKSNNYNDVINIVVCHGLRT